MIQMGTAREPTAGVGVGQLQPRHGAPMGETPTAGRPWEPEHGRSSTAWTAPAPAQMKGSHGAANTRLPVQMCPIFCSATPSQHPFPMEKQPEGFHPSLPQRRAQSHRPHGNLGSVCWAGTRLSRGRSEQDGATDEKPWTKSHGRPQKQQ